LEITSTKREELIDGPFHPSVADWRANSDHHLLGFIAPLARLSFALSAFYRPAQACELRQIAREILRRQVRKAEKGEPDESALKLRSRKRLHEENNCWRTPRLHWWRGSFTPLAAVGR